MSFMSWLPTALDLGGTAIGMPGLGRLAHALTAGSAIKGLRDRERHGDAGFGDYLGAGMGVAGSWSGMFPGSKASDLTGKSADSLRSALTDKPKWRRDATGRMDPLRDALARWRY